MADDSNRLVRLLCRPKPLNTKGSDPGIHFWLIGSPFFPPLTVASFLRRIHALPSAASPDLPKESEDLRTLIPRGFEVVGALASGDDAHARAAVDAARTLSCVVSLTKQTNKKNDFCDFVGAQRGFEVGTCRG